MNLFAVVAFLACAFNAGAQLVANGNSGQTTTNYTNGAPNNPIYIWCGTTLGANNGSLTATPTTAVGGPFTFEWFYHDQATSSWFSFNTTTGASSTLNNLASDGYRVEIRNSSGVTVNCFIAWVWNLNTTATANAVANGCNATLNGSVNTNGSFTYYNPPPPESIITTTTNITVCFTATHTWVSDIAFYLVGPASCGSPTILLSPNPGAIGQGAVCNAGDNVNNLCFSRTSTNTLNICTAGTPLTGTYGRYGPANTPINWNPLNGCNAAQGGWRVQIYDCIGGDVGVLTNATITFSNLQSICGSPTTITYNSGPINSIINDNSCSAATASLFQVPVATNLLTPITVNATTALQWTASPTVTITNPTNANASASGLPNGTTTFTLTATTSFGGVSCVRTATSSVNVTTPVVNPQPNQTHCQGANVPATVFSSTPTGATFAWTNTNTGIGLGANGTGNLPAFAASNASGAPITSTISVTPTLSGCTGPASTFTITINPTPTMVPPAAITQCAGTVSPANFVSNPNGASFTWTNTNTAIGLSATGNGNILPFLGTNNGATPISGTIAITPTLNGCVGLPANFSITINPTPVITQIADLTDCENVVLPATGFTVTPASATISWSNSNTAIGLGTSGIGNLPSFTLLNGTASPISGLISVSATDNGCSSVPMDFIITANVVPSVDPIANQANCHNTLTQAVVFSSPNGVSAIFDWVNSNPTIGLSSSGTGDIPSFNASNPTTSALVSTVTVTPSIGSCVGSPETFTFTVNPLPIPVAQNNGPLCPGENLVLTVNGVSGASYDWSGPNGFSSQLQNPTLSNITVANGGVYSVVVDVAGCSGTSSTNLTINPMVAPNINQVGPFCISDGAINLVASIPGGTWSGNGITNAINGEFSPITAGAGTHTINYNVIAPCALPAITTIVVNPLPAVNFSAPVQSGCEPLTVEFTDNSNPSSNSVSWNFGDGNTSSQTGTVSHTFNNVGCYDISLTSISAAGCINSQTLTDYICVHPYAQASFSVDNPVHSIIYPEFQFFNSSVNATTYTWDFGDGTGSNAVNPSHEYSNQPGSYTVTLLANNQFNCPDSASLTLSIQDQLIFHVPNSFTPDGDEHNNMFEPVFYSGFDPQSYTLLIFNRWGEIIFESHDVTQGWHGTYLDGTVKEGVYTWTIQFKVSESDKKVTYSGHVTLLK